MYNQGWKKNCKNEEKTTARVSHRLREYVSTYRSVEGDVHKQPVTSCPKQAEEIEADNLELGHFSNMTVALFHVIEHSLEHFTLLENKETIEHEHKDNDAANEIE